MWLREALKYWVRPRKFVSNNSHLLSLPKFRQLLNLLVGFGNNHPHYKFSIRELITKDPGLCRQIKKKSLTTAKVYQGYWNTLSLVNLNNSRLSSSKEKQNFHFNSIWKASSPIIHLTLLHLTMMLFSFQALRVKILSPNLWMILWLRSFH